MMNNSKFTRQEFLSTKFLKITLIQLEKSILHHNRFIFQIVTDRKTQQSKKKYNQIKKFSEQLQSKLGMKQLIVENHLRSAQQYKQIQNLFNKLNNGGYMMIKENGNEAQFKIINNVRNYLYNLLFSSIQMTFQSQQQTQMSKNTRITEDITAEMSNIKLKVLEESSQLIQKGEKKLLETQNKEEKRQRQKSSGFKNVIKNIYKSRKQNQEQKKQDMLKNIKTIWLLQNQQWHQKQFIIMEGYLIYYEIQNNFKKIILLKNFEIALQNQQYIYIKISHLVLNQSIKIRIDNQFNVEKDQKSHNQYLTLLFLLKQTQAKNDNRVYNFITIRLTNKKNKFIINQSQKKPTKELNIKIGYQIEPQLYSFEYLDFALICLSIVLLMCYFQFIQIMVQITEERQGGLLNLRQNKISFDLPVQNMYDQIYNEKPKMKIPDMKNHILTSKQCNYIIKLISYISSNEKDRFQGLEIPNQFSRDQFRIQKNRMKRILYSAEKLIEQIKSLQNFQYPIRSTLFYLFLFIAIFLFDANYIIHYILIGLLGIMAYFHPSTSSYIRQIIFITNLGKFVQNMEKKIMQKEHEIRYGVIFKKDLDKKIFLEKFNIRTKIKRNILEKYHRLHEILLKGQLKMTQFVTLSQKIKNIVMWYHHKKTKELFLVILAILIVILYIPIRFFFLAGLYIMYIKGRGYYQRVRKLNEIIIYQIIKITIQENNFLEMRIYLQDINKQFEKKLFDTPFSKQLKENLSNFIEIQFDQQIFVEAKSFKQIIYWVSDCKKRFIIKQEICHKYKFNSQWSTGNSQFNKLLLCIYAFIINVPSDRHILITKSLEVENERNDTDSEDDEFN